MHLDSSSAAAESSPGTRKQLCNVQRSAYIGPCVVVSWVGSGVLPVLGGCSVDGVVPLQQVTHAFHRLFMLQGKPQLQQDSVSPRMPRDAGPE